MVNQEVLNTVFEAVSFASQALANLPVKLQDVLDHQNDNAKAWQRQAAQVVQACEKRLEILGGVVANELQQALDNVKYRDELLAQVQEEMRNVSSRIQAYKQLEDDLRLEIHKKEQDCKTLEKELAFQHVDKQRLSDTLASRERENRQIKVNLDGLEERCSFLEDQHTKDKKTRVAEVHKIKTSWEAEVKEKDEEIGQLYDQCSDVNRDLSEMNSKMREMAAASKKLKEKLTAQQEDSGKVVEDLKTSQALAESQKQTIDQLTKEVSQLKAEVESKLSAEEQLQDTIKDLEDQKVDSESKIQELSTSKEGILGEVDEHMRTVVQKELEIKKLKEELDLVKEELEDMKDEERLKSSRKKEEEERARKEMVEEDRRQREKGERPRRQREKPKAQSSSQSFHAPTFSLDAALRGEVSSEMHRQRATSQDIKNSPDQMEDKIKKTEMDLQHYYHYVAKEATNDAIQEEVGPEGTSAAKRKPPKQPPPPPKSLLRSHPTKSSAADLSSPPSQPSAQPNSAPNTLQKKWNSISKSRNQEAELSSSSSEEDDDDDDSDGESSKTVKEAEEVISSSKDVYNKLKELKAQRQQSLDRAQKSLRRLSVKPMSPISR